MDGHSQVIKIAGVIPGSPAMASGIAAGDRLLSVNGIIPRDTIEYSYLACGESVRLRVLSGRRIRTLAIQKDCDANLGLVFDSDCFDGVKRCRNRCLFCFVDQLPRGLRSSLYEKDDDYRLSFLHGNFLTMTNMDEREICRILDLHLSPLYISVHATEPDIRGFLLGRSTPAPVLDRVARLAGGGITMHIQIVLCPGINDGGVLSKTVDDLAGFWPQVASIGVVPLGLTRFRSDLPKFRAFARADCSRLIRQADTWQSRFRRRFGTSFVYLADEIYIRARAPFPAGCRYDRFPQLANGIGQGRLFLDEFHRLSPALPGQLRRRRRLFVVTGKAGAAVLGPAVRRLNAIRRLDLSLIPAGSILFGPRITVTGLLTGRDLLWALRGLRGEEALLPGVVLRQGTSLLLDGMSVEQVACQTGCHIRVLKPTAGALAEEIVSGSGSRESGKTGRMPAASGADVCFEGKRADHA